MARRPITPPLVPTADRKRVPAEPLAVKVDPQSQAIIKRTLLACRDMGIGWTQMSDECGVPHTTLYQFCANRRPLSLTCAYRVCRMLGLALAVTVTEPGPRRRRIARKK